MSFQREHAVHRSRSRSRQSSLHVQEVLKLYSHCYFMARSRGNSKAIWNLCIKFALRPNTVLIVCEDSNMMSSLCRNNHLRRAITLLPSDDKPQQPSQRLSQFEEFILNANSQIFVLTLKKFAAYSWKESNSLCRFGLIINASFSLKLDTYQQMCRLLKVSGKIITVVNRSKAVYKLTEALGVKFDQVSCDLTEAEINKEILAGIQFQGVPRHDTMELIKSLPFKPEEVAARLYESCFSSLQFNVSRITGAQGRITFLFSSNKETSINKLCTLISSQCGKDLAEMIENPRTLKTGKGVVFDLADAHRSTLEKLSRKLERNAKDFEGQSICVLNGQMPQLEQSHYIQTERQQGDVGVTVAGLIEVTGIALEAAVDLFNLHGLKLKFMHTKASPSAGMETLCFSYTDTQTKNQALAFDGVKVKDNTITIRHHAD